jgi:hypothetical protein
MGASSVPGRGHGICVGIGSISKLYSRRRALCCCHYHPVFFRFAFGGPSNPLGFMNDMFARREPGLSAAGAAAGAGAAGAGFGRLRGESWIERDESLPSSEESEPESEGGGRVVAAGMEADMSGLARACWRCQGVWVPESVGGVPRCPC